MLRASLQMFQDAAQRQPSLRQPGRPLSSNVSRWLGYMRYASLLSPRDLASMIHGAAFINRVPIKQEGDGKALLRLHERSDAEADGQCDGRVCGGACLGPRKLLTEKPLRFSFAPSPREPLDDSELNNFACLTVRHEPSAQLQQMERFVETAISQPVHWPGATVDYCVLVRVNRAFERLFGWNQQQVRALYLQHSFFALFQLFPEQEWGRVMDMEACIEYGLSAEYEGVYQLQTQCLHRLGTAFTCLLHKVYERDDHGVVVKACITFIPVRSAEMDSVRPMKGDDHTAV